MAFRPPMLKSVYFGGCSKFRSGLISGGYSRLALTSDNNHQVEQVATLRLMRGEKYPYPRPWPYKSIRLNAFLNIFENTDRKLNEQSKIIVIEGSAGVGKHDFGKRLASEFDLHFQPGVQNKNLWVDRYSLFDRRLLNEALHPLARMLDFKEMYSAEELNMGRCERMQAEVMENRLLAYALGQLHLFSSGQGFVTVRSPYSDIVFVETMLKMGWITGGYAGWHRRIMQRMTRHIQRPHLHIYLHVPVDVVLEKARKRQAEDPDFAAGPNLDRKFLQTLEDRYMRYLDAGPKEDGEVMKIDWSEEAMESEWDEILDAVESIDLEGEDNQALQFYDWKFITNDIAGHKRQVASLPDAIIENMYYVQPRMSPEFFLPKEVQEDTLSVFRQHDMTRYSKSLMNSNPLKLMLMPYRN